jgi:hypothetical protein
LLRQFLPAYLHKYPHTPAGVLRVLNRLVSCRTAALGGHVLACTSLLNNPVEIDLYENWI